MIENIINNIAAGNQVKENLLQLKTKLKESFQEGTLTDALLVRVNTKISTIAELLNHEDPKIRQNAAICLGYLDPGSDELLIQAYQKDDTLYNKAAYLKAISFTNYETHLEVLKDRMNYIMTSDITPEALNHYSEEVRELNKLICSLIDTKGQYIHSFSGYDLVNECVLLTNRNHKDVTMKQLNGIPHKEFTAGVMVKTKHLDQVMQLRTFEEILFIPEGIRTCSTNAAEAATALKAANVDSYILSRLDNTDIPVSFRVDVKSPDTKFTGDFEKKLAMAWESVTGWHFINSTSDYEIEIRFVDTGKNSLNLLIRFCSLKDERFSYRKESISVGMKPVTAALCCKLAEPYLKKNAAVLDPFCGVATMLVERDRLRPARLIYGIDLFKDAIEGAAKNIRAAGITGKTELITKNFFDFHHEHRFDEIITDFPFCTEQRSLRDIDAIYRDFFRTVPMLLERDNVLVIYTRNKNILKKYAAAANFRLLAEFEISKREMTDLVILTCLREEL